MYGNYFKRIIDLLLAGLVFIAASPIFLLITFALFLSNKGQPFFVQDRPGRDSQIFKIIKFKTMNDRKDANGELLPDSHRLTSAGKFIRQLSLDEIPQLLNVIKGDMSLIGPRPLLVQYLPLYSDLQKKRHNVRPGITGWAQINGRNAISWQQKFEYDVWYVENLSFILDVKIVLKTIKKILIREGISQEGQATMEPFKGN